MIQFDSIIYTIVIQRCSFVNRTKIKNRLKIQKFFYGFIFCPGLEQHIKVVILRIKPLSKLVLTKEVSC